MHDVWYDIWVEKIILDKKSRKNIWPLYFYRKIIGLKDHISHAQKNIRLQYKGTIVLCWISKLFLYLNINQYLCMFYVKFII